MFNILHTKYMLTQSCKQALKQLNKLSWCKSTTYSLNNMSEAEFTYICTNKYNVIGVISIQHSNYFDLYLLYDAAENQEMMMVFTSENLSWKSWKRLKTECLCKTISMTNLVYMQCEKTNVFPIALQYFYLVYIYKYASIRCNCWFFW